MNDAFFPALPSFYQKPARITTVVETAHARFSAALNLAHINILSLPSCLSACLPFDCFLVFCGALGAFLLFCFLEVCLRCTCFTVHTFGCRFPNSTNDKSDNCSNCREGKAHAHFSEKRGKCGQSQFSFFRLTSTNTSTGRFIEILHRGGIAIA